MNEFRQLTEPASQRFTPIPDEKPIVHASDRFTKLEEPQTIFASERFSPIPSITRFQPPLNEALPVHKVLERLSRAEHTVTDTVKKSIKTTEKAREQIHEFISDKQAIRAKKKEEKTQRKAEQLAKQKKMGKDRRKWMKQTALVGGVAAVALIPETRAIAKGIGESAWLSIVNGRVVTYPLWNQGEDVIFSDGVPCFRRWAENDIYAKALKHPEIFDHTRDLPRRITAEIQQSDSLRYPNRPPEDISWYMQESGEVSEVMIDGIAQLYLNGLLTFTHESDNEPLLLAEIQQRARLIVDQIKKTLQEKNVSGPVSSLNPNSQNTGALVNNELIMQEMVLFTQENGELSQFGRLHNPLRSDDNEDLPNPLKAAIARKQAYILELAYRRMDRVAKLDSSADEFGELNTLKKSQEGISFRQNVFNKRIVPGLKKLTELSFQEADLLLGIFSLHNDELCNMDLLATVDTNQVTKLAQKLQTSGSNFTEFQTPGSVFGLGAGIALPSLRWKTRTETTNTHQRLLEKVKKVGRITRRAFLYGTGVTAAAAGLVIADVKLNKHPIIPNKLFDGDTWQQFLTKAPMLTREDLTTNMDGTARFYYSDGASLDGTNEQTKTGNLRESCTANDIPSFFKTALVAVEDHRMYEHDGVDPVGVVRSLAAKIQGEKEGASTIAMQVVRNIFGNIDVDTRNWSNKKIETVGALFLFQHEKAKVIAEAEQRGSVLSDEQARRITHDKILLDYMNIVPFRGNIYGIKKAAELFFGKSSPNELTEVQQLFLAGLPNSPVLNDPLRYEVGITGRETERGTIILFPSHPALQRMDTTYGMLCANPHITLTQEQKTSIENVLKHGIEITIPPNKQITPSFNYTQQLYARIPREQLTLESEVITTIDRKLDMKVKEIGDWAVEELFKQYGTDKFDIVVRDIATGKVLSLYGNPGQTHMIGSLAKAVTVSAAMEAGVKPNDMVSDQPFSIPEESFVSRNIDGLVAETGQMTLNEALEQSRNNPFLWLISQVGITRYTEMMQRLGLIDQSQLINLNDLGPTATLGTNPITNALRISSAFATLGNNGLFCGSTGIEKITNQSIGLLYESNMRAIEQVVDPQIAQQFIAMLSNPEHKLSRFTDSRYIVKTGTSTNMSDDETEGPFNGWTAGYALVDPSHRYQITCVGYRGDGTTPLLPGAGGENTAGEVYKKIADYLFDEY